MRWLRGGPGDKAEEERQPGRWSPPATSDWARQALDGMAAVWLRVDSGLHVVDASPLAVQVFGAPELPSTLIAFTRSARIEEHAGEVLGGTGGPWDIDGTASLPTLRLRGVGLGDGTALLHLEDISEVRRLEAVRADFVANLAHELRTPVASLSLAAETLSGGLPPAEQELFLARIADETRYIEGLLRTVSELAFLEDSVKLQLDQLRLRELVAESWRRVVALHGPAQLENRVPPSMEVTADRVRVTEVLQNLLDNAHRYNAEDAAVEVGAEAGPDEVTVWVADNGPGIPPSDLPRVFERFYKVDRARTRHGDGSGLGLAICKHLVTAHGGQIWAAPGADGGTRVSFSLPHHR